MEEHTLCLMRLVFRADASIDTGSGHVMRCSAIAEEALAQGIDCILVGSLGGIQWLEKRYTDIKCQVTPLEGFLKSQGSDVLVIDSYSISKDDDFITQHPWLSRVDIVDQFTPARESDLLIHPGLDGDWFTGDRANFLYGSKFIPFRKSIAKKPIEKSDELGKLVVFGGGTDPYGFARVMSLELYGLHGYKKATFFSSERDYIEDLDSRFTVLPFGAALDNELDSADLVFTTASTSSLEVLARGIPLGVACSVDNQAGCYGTLNNSKVAVGIGERIKTGDWNMHPLSIKSLIFDVNFRDQIRLAAENYIDFSGAKRIVDAISSL
jgi:spore coat polysaccharide biosynthesis predicted glycosyltransferase SpsG